MNNNVNFKTIRFFIFLPLLLVISGLSSYSPVYASHQALEKTQKYASISNTALSENTSELDLKFTRGEKNPLDFSPKEVIPPTTETSAASILYNPKVQKHTTASLIKEEAASRVSKLYFNNVNNSLCLSNFDNLAGFLIQKQLKTNT